MTSYDYEGGEHRHCKECWLFRGNMLGAGVCKNSRSDHFEHVITPTHHECDEFIPKVIRAKKVTERE